MSIKSKVIGQSVSYGKNSKMTKGWTQVYKEDKNGKFYTISHNELKKIHTNIEKQGIEQFGKSFKIGNVRVLTGIGIRTFNSVDEINEEMEDYMRGKVKDESKFIKNFYKIDFETFHN